MHATVVWHISAAGLSIATSSVATSETAATGLPAANAGKKKQSLVAVPVLLKGNGKYPHRHIIGPEESQYVQKESLQLVDAQLDIYTTPVFSGAHVILVFPITSFPRKK